jgi:hypothetical protein
MWKSLEKVLLLLLLLLQGIFIAHYITIQLL